MRGGERFPQDRLYSGRISFFAIIPVASMIYGWCLQYEFGGLALPIVAAFFVGFGLMAAFSSLNTYCGGKSCESQSSDMQLTPATEAIPEQRIKIIASKYFIQYIFGAAGNAAIVPLIDGVGVGIASTIGKATSHVSQSCLSQTLTVDRCYLGPCRWLFGACCGKMGAVDARLGRRAHISPQKDMILQCAEHSALRHDCMNLFYHQTIALSGRVAEL